MVSPSLVFSYSSISPLSMAHFWIHRCRDPFLGFTPGGFLRSFDPSLFLLARFITTSLVDSSGPSPAGTLWTLLRVLPGSPHQGFTLFPLLCFHCWLEARGRNISLQSPPWACLFHIFSPPVFQRRTGAIANPSCCLEHCAAEHSLACPVCFDDVSATRRTNLVSLLNMPSCDVRTDPASIG